MSNPFKPHALNLFADRESVDKAMEYAHALLQTLDGPAATAATTALMVVVNTAAKLWPEAPAQVTDLSALDALRSRIAALEEWRDGPSPIPTHFIQLVDERVLSWAEDHFTARADEWLSDDADLDDKIETWVENNLDIENEVADALRDKVYDTVRRVIRDEVSVSISI
jgi:hypothetical protein